MYKYGIKLVAQVTGVTLVARAWYDNKRFRDSQFPNAEACVGYIDGTVTKIRKLVH